MERSGLHLPGKNGTCSTSYTSGDIMVCSWVIYMRFVKALWSFLRGDGAAQCSAGGGRW